MRYSMMSYTWSRQSNYFDLVKMLDQVVELKMAGVDFVTLHDKPAKELRKMADDRGLPVVCHTFMADMDFPTASERQAGVDKAMRGIEAAKELGAPVVMIPTPGKREGQRAVSRTNWIEGLKHVVPFGAKAGIAVSIENFPGADSPFVIAADMLEAVRAVPGLKLTYDNGNAAGGENPAFSFSRCAQDVVHAHFKDWTIRPAGSTDGMLMLDGRRYVSALIGEGDVDQASCLAVMTAAGYAGCINIEYEGDKYRPDEATCKAVEYLRHVE